MTGALADQGSFRDPSGRVYRLGGQIFRTVAPAAAEHYDFVKSTGLFERLTAQGRLVATREADHRVLGGTAADAQRVLHHETIPFVSYPYEWSFPLLKSAALLHLGVQIEALKRGVSLSDATAYNVQFRGIRPVFIDVLSFRRHREGEVWAGHRQFCEQFLNPLLLRALLGVPHNAWFRGALEGIETAHLASLLPFRRKWAPNVFAHVVMLARLQRKALSSEGTETGRARSVTLAKQSYLRMLESLRAWIARLQPAGTGATVWQDYERSHTYSSEEERAKHAFVAAFCARAKPALLWDLGCNSGEYSETALASGAAKAVGFDFDQGALEAAYARAKAKSLDFLPLFQDGANPSPDQGWASRERRGTAARGGAQALMALAFEHHLAIGRNVPLPDVVQWLVSLAPAGVIEFVAKNDRTVRRLLALREDIFPDYTIGAFEAALGARARIVKRQSVSAEGRTLFLYDRS